MRIIFEKPMPIKEVALTPKEASVVLWHLRHQCRPEGPNTRAMREKLERIAKNLPDPYGD